MTKSNLIPTPNEELLAQERARCARLTARLEKQRDQLRRSREEWAPAYKTWYAEEVEPLANRARNLLQRARDQSTFIRAVEEAARVLYCKPIEARPKVSSAARGAVIFEELFHEFHEGHGFPRGPLHPDAEMHLRLKFARSVYPLKNPARLEELFQEHVRNLLEDLFGWECEPAAPLNETRLKQLYRELARRLHPDSNAAAGKAENDLWHEVTAAFRGQDQETLENILASLDSGGRFERIDSLGRLRAILARVEAKLNEVKREVRGERRQPWWKFGKANDREELARKLRQEHERTILIAEAELARQAAKFREWENQTL